MQKLPVDISTFSELRKSNYLYVDKTEYVYKLITGGRRFFLSRPRRFGKSLLVSTMKEVLTANKILFEDLWIGASDYNWKEWGVINLDFSQLVIDDLDTLKNRLGSILRKNAELYDIPIKSSDNSPDLIVQELVAALYKRFGYVAILIDEYDSPLLKTLSNEALATSIRDMMQQFFSIIKSLDAQVQFVFITGVSSFAKAGLFSGINNLQILTLRDEFGAICGYTDQEVNHYFHEYINDWALQESISYDPIRQQIKKWYNGYRFGDKVLAVYNPFSVLNALHIKSFENFWFQSGTPRFLIEVLKKNQHEFDPVKSMIIHRDALGSFDVGKTPLITLMFQAGYLTIQDYNNLLQTYTLDYPNEEVRVSFQKYLLEVFAYIEPSRAAQLSAELYTAFVKEDIEEVIEVLYQLFAHVPYQLYMKAERYYHSLFMMICIGAGIKAQSEYSTQLGRIDLVLEFLRVIYVIEIKFNQSAQEALTQIEERQYHTRFMVENKSIILLGLSFRREPQIFDISYAVKKIEL